MLKKIFLSLVLFLGITFFLSGCEVNNHESKKENSNEKIKVAATIFPLYDLVREVGGEKIDVNLIVPPGSSPHTFEVSPSDIKNLQNTKTVFVIGQNLDAWVENIVKSLDKVEVYDISRVISLKEFGTANHLAHEHEHEEEHEEEVHEDEEEHEEMGVDPHYWLDPVNAVFMARDISNKLAELSPENKTYFSQRADDFADKIYQKDTQWKEKLASLTKKELVVFHSAWGYFADYYSLNVVASFEPFPGQEPTPQYLKELQEEVKYHDVKNLFVEPQFSQESVKTLANDLGVGIGVLDPIGGVEGRASYIDLIDFNVNNVFDLLKAE